MRHKEQTAWITAGLCERPSGCQHGAAHRRPLTEVDLIDEYSECQRVLSKNRKETTS